MADLVFYLGDTVRVDGAPYNLAEFVDRAPNAHAVVRAVDNARTTDIVPIDKLSLVGRSFVFDREDLTRLAESGDLPSHLAEIFEVALEEWPAEEVIA